MDNLCSQCGKETVRLYLGHTCQGCYNYFRSGGTVNELPHKGEIVRDSRGYVVCHICGRAFKRLGSHVRESHGLTIAEYKEEFGLCNSSKTTEQEYSERMRSLAYKYGMPEQLIKTGYNTRIKSGENQARFGKKARLQECLDRSKRRKK